jgi:hypothetical protein
MEGQNSNEDYKRIPHHKSEKPLEQVMDEGQNKDCIQLK